MKIDRIAYCGHSSIILEGSEKVVAIDPWFAGNPTCPDLCQSPGKLDVIVLTHGHSDHAGDAVRLGKQYGSKICATYELAQLLIKSGVPEGNVIPMNKGGSVEVEGFRVSLTHAQHSNSYEFKGENVYAGEACGAIVRSENTCFYHAGDTSLFSDMKLIRETYQPDIGFFPIGDHFTMGPKEAAKAVEFIACKLAIPIHHSTFPLLTGTPEEFEKACLSLDVQVVTLKAGESHSL